MSNFEGGTHWLLYEEDGNWCHRHIDGEKPRPEIDWPDLVDCKFIQVDRPPEMHEMPDDKGAWKPNLDYCRANKWHEAKTFRAKKLLAGCETPYGRIDTTDDSYSNFRSLVDLGNGDNIVFEDNAVVYLGIERVKIVKGCMDKYKVDCMKASHTIREKIYNKYDNHKDIESIDVTANYPK